MLRHYITSRFTYLLYLCITDAYKILLPFCRQAQVPPPTFASFPPFPIPILYRLIFPILYRPFYYSVFFPSPPLLLFSSPSRSILLCPSQGRHTLSLARVSVGCCKLCQQVYRQNPVAKRFVVHSEPKTVCLVITI